VGKAHPTSAVLEMQAQVIDANVVAKERKKDFEISRISRFRDQILSTTD